MKKLAMYFITETKLRKLSGVPCLLVCCWGHCMAADSSGLKKKHLCSPAYVASCLYLLNTISHTSSFCDNFKEGNVVVKYMKMPNSRNSQKLLRPNKCNYIICYESVTEVRFLSIQLFHHELQREANRNS